MTMRRLVEALIALFTLGAYLAASREFIGGDAQWRTNDEIGAVLRQQNIERYLLGMVIQMMK